MRVKTWRNLLILAVVAVVAGVLPVVAEVGPYSGGPTDYFHASDGNDIAMSVVYPDGFTPGRRYPAILEMGGYENGSASADGRTMIGQTKDFLCSLDPSGENCPEEEPPLAEDSHKGTSTHRYSADGYVVVHASLPGSGCSSGQWDLYDFEQAKTGADIIDNWIAKQGWSNGRVGLLGHSYSGSTALLIAAHRPKHLVAVTISGMIDDNYRGITFPGGVFNTLFPPLWYLGIRPAYDIAGGTGQGTVRNLDNENGKHCLDHQSSHRRGIDNDPIVQGGLSQGEDNDFWRRTSMITYIDRITAPIHIAGAYQDEQTGARGTTRLWEHVKPGVPKRLLQFNGDHGTNVEAEETWGDRKAWMDYWIRGIVPAPRWGMTSTGPDGKPAIKRASVRTLFELHPDAEGELVSNGVHDSSGYPLDGTSFTDYYLCGDKTLNGSRQGCKAGTAQYLSGTHRQSWLYQAGPELGPPVTSEDAGDQVLLRAPVVPAGGTWAIAGPMRAHLYLSATGNDTDLFVQVMDEDTVTGERFFLQRGWLKASHRAIDPKLSDYTNVDPKRPGYLYRPHRPHVNPTDIEPNVPIEYLVELWPVAHVFRPGHRLAVVVTAPPAIDSNYSFLIQNSQPVSVNTLIFNDPKHPSRISLPVIPVSAIQRLGAKGPGCKAYWQVRCTS